MPAAQLLSLATAVPPFLIDQPQAKAIGRRAFRREAAFDRLSGVFDNAGIARRNLVAPLDWYERHHGWAERNRAQRRPSAATSSAVSTKAGSARTASVRAVGARAGNDTRPPRQGPRGCGQRASAFPPTEAGTPGAGSNRQIVIAS